MKRLMKQLGELSGDTCDKLLLPLVRTYIYNEEYDAQNIVVEAAIECVGALASKLCWKKYAKLLQQFLSQVSGHIFNLLPPEIRLYVFTLPTAEILSGKNVRAFLVCGFLQ